jgi:hypothetical protein
VIEPFDLLDLRIGFKVTNIFCHITGHFHNGANRVPMRLRLKFAQKLQGFDIQVNAQFFFYFPA